MGEWLLIESAPAQEAHDAIEALVAERDGWKQAAIDAAAQVSEFNKDAELQGVMEISNANYVRAEKLQAERDKLRERVTELEGVLKDARMVVAAVHERHSFDGHRHEWEAFDRLRAYFWPNLAALEKRDA